MGLEVSGRIAEVGASVRRWQVGDRVCALVPGGGYAERAVVPQVNLGQILGKRIKVIGSTLRNRPTEEKIRLTKRFRDRFWPDMQNGNLKPIIDSVFAMQDAQAAHDHVRANRNTGKVILSLEK